MMLDIGSGDQTWTASGVMGLGKQKKKDGSKENKVGGGGGERGKREGKSRCFGLGQKIQAGSTRCLGKYKRAE